MASLPEFPFDNQDPTRPASEVVSEYYGAYEREKNLPVRHNAEVRAVTHEDGIFTVELADGSTLQARSILRDRDVGCVVSTGGRPSLPVGLAARSLGKPLFLLEQNAVPGRARSVRR